MASELGISENAVFLAKSRVLERLREEVAAWRRAYAGGRTRDIAFSIGYQGSHTSNLLNSMAANDATPGPGPRQSR